MHRPLSSFILYPFVKEIPIEYAVKLLEAGGFKNCQSLGICGVELARSYPKLVHKMLRFADALRRIASAFATLAKLELSFWDACHTGLSAKAPSSEGVWIFISCLSLILTLKSKSYPNQIFHNFSLFVFFSSFVKVSSWNHETCWHVCHQPRPDDDDVLPGRAASVFAAQGRSSKIFRLPKSHFDDGNICIVSTSFHLFPRVYIFFHLFPCCNVSRLIGTLSFSGDFLQWQLALFKHRSSSEKQSLWKTDEKLKKPRSNGQCQRICTTGTWWPGTSKCQIDFFLCLKQIIEDNASGAEKLAIDIEEAHQKYLQNDAKTIFWYVIQT